MTRSTLSLDWANEAALNAKYVRSSYYGICNSQEQMKYDAGECVITLDSITNPLELGCGHVFEQSAIAQYISAGARFCPACRADIDVVDIFGVARCIFMDLTPNTHGNSNSNNNNNNHQGSDHLPSFFVVDNVPGGADGLARLAEHLRNHPETTFGVISGAHLQDSLRERVHHLVQALAAQPQNAGGQTMNIHVMQEEYADMPPLEMEGDDDGNDNDNDEDQDVDLVGDAPHSFFNPS